MKLVALPQRTFTLGLLEEHLTGPGPDFLEPLGEEELADWEAGR